MTGREITGTLPRFGVCVKSNFWYKQLKKQKQTFDFHMQTSVKRCLDHFAVNTYSWLCLDESQVIPTKQAPKKAPNDDNDNCHPNLPLCPYPVLSLTTATKAPVLCSHCHVTLGYRSWPPSTVVASECWVKVENQSPGRWRSPIIRPSTG